MAWIELHQSLREHRKMFACAELLGLSRKEMIGTLVSLWLWALDNAQDGSLGGVSNRTIASVCDWPERKADKLVEAMRISGWIDTGPDGSMIIHDWSDYAGKLMDRREKDRERKRKTNSKPTETERTSAGIPAEVHGNSCATVPKPYLNRTLPTTEGDNKADGKGPTAGAPARFDGRLFTTFWEAYPCKIGREAAWEAWRTINPDQATADQIMSALAVWKASGRWDDKGGRFIPRAANWLSDDEYWKSPPAPAKGDATEREMDEDEVVAIRRMMAGGDDA